MYINATRQQFLRDADGFCFLGQTPISWELFDIFDYWP